MRLIAPCCPLAPSFRLHYADKIVWKTVLFKEQLVFFNLLSDLSIGLEKNPPPSQPIGLKLKTTTKYLAFSRSSVN